MKIDKKDFKSVVGRVNPFLLRNDTGLGVFESAKECYQLVLMALWNDYPCGFVDVPLFMMRHQRLNSQQANYVCPVKQYAYIAWWNLQDENVQFKLKYVLRLFLKPSGLSLDEDLFLNAIENLDYLLDKQGVKDTMKQYQNLHVIPEV